MLHFFALATVMLASPQKPAPAAWATFVPVCRDVHGAWDRRACQHTGKQDPRRMTLALRSAGSYAWAQVYVFI